MAYYFFNLLETGRADERPLGEQAAELLEAGMWGVAADERHRDALAPGDLFFIYLGAPEWKFVGRAELASAVHDWTESEAAAYPGDAPSGVLLTRVEAWDPPVPIDAVLSRLDPVGDAKADHEAGVLRLTPHEYETVLAVAAERAT